MNVVIKVEFFGNENEFKEASAGVQFFSSKCTVEVNPSNGVKASTPFSCFLLEEVQGFVEELIVESDPEYHWVDNFRASRISNVERQMLLYNLSGSLCCRFFL